MSVKLDAVDRKLLELVQADSSLPYAALGREVGLSVSAVNERVRKLERNGAIRRYVALIEPASAGAETLAFVEVGIGAAGDAEAFLGAMAEAPEVLEAHRTTGTRQVLLKLRTADIARLQALVDGLVVPHPAVAATRVTLVLASAKESPALPVAEA